MIRHKEAVLENLSEPACWDLLRSATLGRLAVARPDGADIFPMNFMVHEEAIYVRSAPGLKLIDITDTPAVAFEADGLAGRIQWSVVVRGIAHRLGSDAEIEESGIHELKSQTPWDKWNYVRITPTRVSGRRFTIE